MAVGSKPSLRGLSALVIAVSAAAAWPSAGAPLSQHAAPSVAAAQTEEGQSIVYDAYTWRRRELDKKLPLNEPWPSEAKIAAQFQRFGLDHAPVPETIPTPSRIFRDIYLVNSDTNHAYLIDAGPAGLILIDPGPEANVERILKNVEALGFSRTAIKWVINTHAHYDHSMADARFQRLGAKILVGREDVPAVEKGTLVTAKYVLPPAQIAAYPTLKVDWPVDDGEELKLGDKTLLAIATPGHTAGSTCYLLTIDQTNILFGGDTILFDGRLGAQGTPFADDVAYLASLKKLARLGVYRRYDALLPGHGTLVLNRAYMDVEKGLRQVQWDITTGAPVQALPFADDDYRKLMFGRP